MKKHYGSSPTTLSKEAFSILADGLTDNFPAPPSLIKFIEGTVNFTLHRWQRILCAELKHFATRKGINLLVHAPPQYGKPGSVDSQVQMGDGSYKRLGDIVVGDRVVSHTGTAREVKAVHEQGELECVQIETASGRKTVPALDHPFLTPDGWVEAQALAVGGSLASLQGWSREHTSFQRLGHTYTADRIASIAPAGKRECRCLSVEVDHTFTMDDLVVHNSILVSSRLIAWLIGMDPSIRVALACYNEQHSTEFGKVVRDIMLSHEFGSYFPDSACDIPSTSAAGEFSTVKRASFRDAQFSFLALGLQTGFTGRGADCLIVDDPYKSAQDAYSPLINDRVWDWWAKTASVRISEDTNVIFMFHRYHDTDMIGRLIDRDGLVQDGGKWKMLRFPAIADENEDGCDPTGRKVGELLSTMRSQTFLDDLRDDDPMTFAAQFQGDPNAGGGTFFNPKDYEIISSVPIVEAYARGWDPAYTMDAGDYSAGALVTVDEHGNLIICDIWRKRVTGPMLHQMIVKFCIGDPPGTRVGVEDNTSNKMLIQVLERPDWMFTINLSPIAVHGQSKWQRAQEWAGLGQRGKVKLLRGEWNYDFLKELSRFKNKRTDTDDQIDAVSVAFQALGTMFGVSRLPKPPAPWGSPEMYAALAEDQHRNYGKPWH